MDELIRKDLERFLDYQELYHSGDQVNYYDYINRVPDFPDFVWTQASQMAALRAQVELLQRLEAAGILKSPEEKEI